MHGLSHPEITTWLNANLAPMLDIWGLDEWEVAINIKRKCKDSPATAMECTAQREYKMACINIYSSQIVDTVQLRATLKHELCHILGSSVDHAEEVVKTLGVSGEIQPTIREVFRQVHEYLVLDILKALDTQRRHYEGVIKRLEEQNH